MIYRIVMLGLIFIVVPGLAIFWAYLAMRG